MVHTHRLVVSILAVVGAASVALAQSDANKQPTTPPGMTPEQTAKMKEIMQKCMDAAQPGPMHEHLARAAGVWDGKVKSFEAPGQPPQESTCVMTMKPMLGGRFINLEVKGQMSGMPFEGFAVYGYDNTSKKFQQTWVDNFGTGMMNGTGELSEDGKTMTWTLTYNDPTTGKPGTFKEVETYADNNHSHLEMWGPDPFTGKQSKMMEIDSTRRANAEAPDSK